jgi:repressor LexA
METLTPQRKRILDFIAAFVKENGYSPSVREIANGSDLASSYITQYHLNILEQHGFMKRAHDISRGISLTEKYTGSTAIPLLGTIAAGQPIPVPSSDTWYSIPEESIKLPEDLVDDLQDIYALRVKGTSMIDSMIDDGDIVLMQPATSVENGEVAAVWLKDKQEVTLKKIYRERGRVCLKPANKQMKPIYCKPDDVEVQGKVVAVLRKFTR